MLPKFLTLFLSDDVLSTVEIRPLVRGAVKAGHVLRLIWRSGDMEIHLGGARHAGGGASSGRGGERPRLSTRSTCLCQQKEEEKFQFVMSELIEGELPDKMEGSVDVLFSVLKLEDGGRGCVWSLCSRPVH